MLFGLETSVAILLIVSILAVCAFEFVNGFHDTANAVATVIYTGSLKPQYAVVWSGIWNFLGLIIGVGSGLKVAMGIVELLPLGDMASIGITENIILVLSILLGAIIWNIGTWFYGIPCSSSHTLIGSLLGAGLAFFYTHNNVSNVNWGKATEIGMSLLISPLFGFAMSIILMFIGRQLLKDNRKQIFKEPEPGSTPPGWIRGLLIFTCTGVSYFHGSNDGQKGVGLMLIILMAFFPFQYALTPRYDDAKCLQAVNRIEMEFAKEGRKDLGHKVEDARNAINLNMLGETKETRFGVRNTLTKLNKSVKEEVKLLEDKNIANNINNESAELKKAYQLEPTDVTWVMIVIALSIGLGTMIGWKRIVVTIGEKIGKNHMTYAEGATAEIVAAATIGLSSGLGLPVSTTHVLSSGVAGAMTASKGVKNLQAKTIKTIALAWILTLPVTIILSGGIYYLLRQLL